MVLTREMGLKSARSTTDFFLETIVIRAERIFQQRIPSHIVILSSGQNFLKRKLESHQGHPPPSRKYAQKTNLCMIS